MCWQGHIKDKRIAKEDIVVFKVVYRRLKGWHSLDPKYREIYASPFMSTKYFKGEDYTFSKFSNHLYPIRFNDEGAVKIGKGFHSYHPDHCSCELTDTELVVRSNFGCMEGVQHPMMRYNRHSKVTILEAYSPVEAVAMKCIIPAGSEYWVNASGEVVSTAIRFIEEMKL